MFATEDDVEDVQELPYDITLAQARECRINRYKLRGMLTCFFAPSR